EDAGVIDHAAVPEQRWDGAVLNLRLPLSAQRSDSPAAMHAVLNLPKNPAGLRVAMKVDGAWPPVAAPTPLTAPAEQAAPAPAAPAESWWAAMGLALIGGLLLNLMPCVFPVL